MNFSEEQLKEVESMASLFISVEDIMICLEISNSDIEDFRDILEFHREHPLFKAYHSGRIAALVELRASIKMAALNGSNPAQTSMLNFKTESEL